MPSGAIEAVISSLHALEYAINLLISLLFVYLANGLVVTFGSLFHPEQAQMKAKTQAARLTLINAKDKLSTLAVEYFDPSRKFKRMSTGIKVTNTKNAKGEYTYFDGETIKANGSKDPKTDTQTARQRLADVNAVIDALERKLKRWPMVAELNAALDAKVTPVAAREAPFLEVMQAYIDGRTWRTASTKKNFVTLLHNVQAYELANRTQWLLSSLTNAEIKRFQQWLLDTYDYKNSTAGKRTRLLRQFLTVHPAPHVNIANVKDLHTTLLTTPVVLHQSEIEALRALPLDPHSRLGKVRNLQVLQIFVGVRVSDLFRLRKHHIVGKEIHILEKKTENHSQSRRIPLLPAAREVLDMYTNGETGELNLPTISEQKFNDYIAELAPLYLKDPNGKPTQVLITDKHREVITETWEPKHEHVTSHTNRKSFCSLFLSLGYSIRDTMQMSGHRSLASFQRYMGHLELRVDASDEFAARYAASLGK